MQSQRIFFDNNSPRQDYEIIDFLEKGGSGEVTSYKSMVDGKLYALKKVTYLGKRHTKCLNEVSILLKMNHSNVIKILNYWIEKNEGEIISNSINPETMYSLYMVFPLMNLSLFQLYKKDWFVNLTPKLRTSAINKINICVLKALEYIHEKHIIHCDLKMDNILVNLDNDECITEVTICDFGLALQYKCCKKYGYITKTEDISRTKDTKNNECILKYHSNQSSVSNCSNSTCQPNHGLLGNSYYMPEEKKSGHFGRSADIAGWAYILFKLITCLPELKLKYELTFVKEEYMLPVGFAEDFPVEATMLEKMICKDYKKRSTAKALIADILFDQFAKYHR